MYQKLQTSLTWVHTFPVRTRKRMGRNFCYSLYMFILMLARKKYQRTGYEELFVREINMIWNSAISENVTHI